MRRVKCVACGLVNLESFPAFPTCEGCGSHLSVVKRRWWPTFGARPVKTLVWAFSVGAGVATLALLSVGIARETRLHDRGALVVAPFVVPRGHGDLLLSLHVGSRQSDDREPIRNLRLRVSQKSAREADVHVVSPMPSTVQRLAGGHYFVWDEFPPRDVIVVRLQGKSGLTMGLVADEFEPFVLRLSPHTRDASPRKGANYRDARIQRRRPPPR